MHGPPAGGDGQQGPGLRHVPAGAGANVPVSTSSLLGAKFASMKGHEQSGSHCNNRDKTTTFVDRLITAVLKLHKQSETLLIKAE
jgi:hypothetical protein